MRRVDIDDPVYLWNTLVATLGIRMW